MPKAPWRKQTRETRRQWAARQLRRAATKISPPAPKLTPDAESTDRRVPWAGDPPAPSGATGDNPFAVTDEARRPPGSE